MSRIGQETIRAQGPHRSWGAGPASACPPRLFHEGSGRQLGLGWGDKRVESRETDSEGAKARDEEAGEASGRATPSHLQTQTGHTRAETHVSGTPFSTAGRRPPGEAEFIKTRLSGRQVAGPRVRGPERVAHDQRPSWRGERPGSAPKLRSRDSNPRPVVYLLCSLARVPDSSQDSVTSSVLWVSL